MSQSIQIGNFYPCRLSSERLIALTIVLIWLRNDVNFQVKVKTWVNGHEGKTLGGLSARFGTLLPAEAEQSKRLPAILSNPQNGCANSSVQVFIFVTLVMIHACMLNRFSVSS